MTRITKLIISNFKAFPEKEEITFDGKNILIYGENGSGKSSIFYALHALLQSSEKSNDKIQNYFDSSHKEKLTNIFSFQASEDSFIEIQLKDKNYADPRENSNSYTISYNEINTNTSNEIKEINKASDFINYKVLMEFHNFRHSQEIELFNLFYKEIFPYFSNDKNELLSNVIDIIEKDSIKLRVAGTKEKFDFTKSLDDFNNFTDKLIKGVLKDINYFSKEYFSEGNYNIKLDLDYQNAEYDYTEYKFKFPSIKLLITLPDKNNELVTKPHSFFNEAKLTGIALSIRFALLKYRVKTTSLKILVLDDLLVSLDMSNRIKTLKMIFKEFRDFQIIIMTHDKSFYNEIKRRVLTSEWKFFNVVRKNNIPKIEDSKNELEKAKEYFEDKNYELCAVELRKRAEEILKLIISPEKVFDKEYKGLEDLIREARNKFKDDNYKTFKKMISIERFEEIFNKKGITLEEIKLIQKDLDSEPSLTNNPNLKGRLRALKNEIFDFAVKQHELNKNEDQILGELKNIKDRIFNPASHSSTVPFFNEELREAIQIVQHLENILTSRGLNS